MLDGGLRADSILEPRLQRSHGCLSLSLAVRDGRTAIAGWYQSGAAKARAPKVYSHHGIEALLINTSGGLTGGDTLDVSLAVGEAACGIFTSQASEKIYRSLGGTVSIKVDMSIAENGRGYWVPQDTIFFDGAALSRELRLTAEESAEFLIMEPLVFGREAMRERVSKGRYRDSWRVSVDGQLVFAEEARLDGDIGASLERPALGRGATAFLTGLYRGPAMTDKRDALRGISCREGTWAGASLLRGALSFRVAAQDPADMRRWMVAAYGILSGLPAPVAWRC